MSRAFPARRTHTARALGAAGAVLFLVMSARVGLDAQVTQPNDARYYEQQALKAYRDKALPVFLENMKLASDLRPNHPRLTYNLAVAHALNGNQGEALTWLDRLTAMGMFLPAERDEDFASLRDSARFNAILAKFRRNHSPLGKSSHAFTIAEKGFVPESVAYDPVGKVFYLGSVYKRKILKTDGKGAVAEFANARDGLWSVMGMKVDARRRHLWVCSASQPQMMNFVEAEDGLSAIFKFDLSTGKLLKKYALPNRPAKRWLGDLALNSRGDVFATDSLSAAVYTIPHARDEIELFVEGEPFASPQGLDFSPDEKRLFVADYARGIFVIDLLTKQITGLEPAPDVMPFGADGLYFYRGSLIAIQNSANPHRVVRFRLSRDLRRIESWELIEANNPAFDEPTLGVLVKDMLYYVANSQWGAVNKNGELASEEKLLSPVVLKTRL